MFVETAAVMVVMVDLRSVLHFRVCFVDISGTGWCCYLTLFARRRSRDLPIGRDAADSDV